MDFLDPKRERRQHIFLLTGYALIGLAIAIASLLLLYQTDGYCVDKKGAVDRCGLVFVSSQPSGALVTIDGKKQQPRTNTKFNMRSGSYLFNVSQTGYMAWQRQIEVNGGDVQRFDYPLLIPEKLQTSTISTVATKPSQVTQSPDKRWLLLFDAAAQTPTFRELDLRKTTSQSATALSMPADVFTAPSSTTETPSVWEVVEWSSDNRHMLLKHTYAAPAAADSSQTNNQQEYLVFDRQTPQETRNITRELALGQSERLSLFNKKPTAFYAYNPETKTLRTLALNGGAPTNTELPNVEAYKTDGADSILYVTSVPPSGKTTIGKVSVVLQRGEQVRVLRQLQVSQDGYLLDMARYDGDWYVLVAAKNAKGAYVYKNPIDQQLETPSSFPAPFRFLRLDKPGYASFSATAQFVAMQQGQQFVVYNFDSGDTYRFSAANVSDIPQTYFQWMDGNRLATVSGGKVTFIEYDNLNPRTLTETDAQSGFYFSPDFRRLLTLKTQASGTTTIQSTSLVAQP